MPSDKFIQHVVVSDDEAESGVDAIDIVGVDDYVVAKCANCATKLCDVSNEWIKITGSYFLEAHQWKSMSTMEVTAKGDVRPGGKNSRLEGCHIQPLHCNSCSETVGFKCLQASNEKQDFKDRVFFKLSRMTLVSVSNGMTVTPKEVTVIPAPAVTQSVPKSTEPIEAPAQAAPPQQVASKLDQNGLPLERAVPSEADLEAIEALKVRSEPWRDVHEVWERRTQRGLSPAAFGRHIMSFPAFDGARNGSQFYQLPAGQKYFDRPKPKPALKPKPSVQPVIENGTPLMVNYTATMNATQNGAQYHPHPQHPLVHQQVVPAVMPMDNLQIQRKDVNRIDQAVNRLNQDMTGLRQAFKDFTKEMRHRSGPNAAPGDDSDTIELLSETVASTAAKVGEIDSLKMQVELLKLRLRKVENAESITQEGSNLQTIRALQQQNSSWDTGHPLKRKRTLNLQETTAGGKRQSLPSRTEGADSPASAMNPDVVNVFNSARGSILGTNPLVMAGQPPVRRGPGRPRKSELIYGNDNTWDGRISADAFAANLPRAESIYSATDGLSQSTQNQLNPLVGKRTRTKPVRDENGVLTRKDGKPDKRSISSPQNLMKVHQKKVVTPGTGSNRTFQSSQLDGIGGTSTQSPLAKDITAAVKNDENDSLADSGSLDTPDLEGDNTIGDTTAGSGQVNGQAIPTDKHSSIMNAMFPNGLQGDAKRMNPGSQMFSPSKLKMQARVHAERDGIRATIRIDDGAVVEQEQNREGREDSMEIH